MLKRIILFVIAVCLLCSCLPLCAFTAPKSGEENVIKVAWPVLGTLSQVDKDGNCFGYDYDYLQKIAQYTGWEYEFVQFKSADLNERLLEALDMLKKGEVDILGGVSQSEATLSAYDFPSYSYGTAYYTLLVPNESTSFYNMNDLAQKQLRVAVYANAKNTNLLLKQFCDANKIDLVTVECENEADLVDAAYNGKADAIISNDLIPIEGMRSIARYGGEPYYFAVTKGNYYVTNALSSALFNIHTVNPYFEEEMYRKYFNEKISRAVFTQDEREYINEHQTLNVLLSTQAAPFQYLDSESNVAGVSKNVLDIISEQTGINFNYIVAKSHDEFIQAFGNQQIDLIAGVPYNYDFGNAYKTVFTNPFASSSMTMVMLANSGNKPWSESVLALPYGSFWTEQTKFKQVDFYSSVIECLAAVASGKADYSYGNVYSMGYYMQENRKNMIALPYPGETTDFCIGVLRPANIDLISIINKVIRTIPEGDIPTMLFNNTIDGNKNVTLASFIVSNPVESIAAIFIIATVIILLITIILYTRTRANRQLRLDNERYLLLSEMANEYLFEYEREKDVLKLSRTCADMLGIETTVTDYSKKIDSHIQDDKTAKTLHKIITNSGTETEVKLQTVDGSMRWFNIVNAIVTDRHKKQQYIVGKLVDIQDEKHEKELLLEKSQRDSLTGLYNVASCKEQVTEYLSTKPKEELGAFLICDIDNFKDINDSFGHANGDSVLLLVTDILRGLFRQQDIIARMGGDEFVIFMRGVKTRDTFVSKSAQLCEEMRQRISFGGNERRLTVSVGSALTIYENDDYESLYRRADAALYRVKEHGKDGFAVDGQA